MLTDRYVNLAPQAQAVTRGQTEKAAHLINELSDQWDQHWANLPEAEGDRAKTIVEEPESLTLAWPHPVALNGIALQFPGFTAADIDAFKGSDSAHPRDAADSDWEKITDVTGLDLYSTLLNFNWVDFGKTVTTPGLRLRITTPIAHQTQGHLKGHDRDGKRVWLSEWLALAPLGSAALESVLPAPVATRKQASDSLLIPVNFSLPEDGFVTLVIEDKDGKRVRNLIAETPFPKGNNVTWWDGNDDLGRDLEAAKHGLYRIPAQPVAPGQYKVRGLWRKAIHAYYEFGAYFGGNPPWNTADHTGAWLANHCPPMSAAFVPAVKSPTKEPAMFLGSWMSEGTDGLIWTDLDGKKRGGKGWIGGNWRSAPYVAVDSGEHSNRTVQLYVANIGQSEKSTAQNVVPELSISALTKQSDKLVLRLPLEPSGEAQPNLMKELGGVAAYNGTLVCSLTKANQLLFINAVANLGKQAGEIAGSIHVESPRGVAYDATGQLLALSGNRLLRAGPAGTNQDIKVLVRGLEDPVGITLDETGNIYISDRGASHQVKVFAPDGKFIRAIGKAGVPKAGPYDPLHMNNPRGLSIDSHQHLWVTEEDCVPKRVSLWTLDGKLLNAFYGPGKYGGGGTLDPVDKSRFYYSDGAGGAMEFKLDWAKGTSQLMNILCRQDPQGFKWDDGGVAAPETPLYRKRNGTTQRYFMNCFNSIPTSGGSTAVLFIEKEGHVIQPVAAMANGMACKELLKEEAFRGLVPEGVNFDYSFDRQFFCIWSDLNFDGKVQPNEISITKEIESNGITIMPDFSFCVAFIGPKEGIHHAVRFAPVEFDRNGVPRYDYSKGQSLVAGVQSAPSSGGNQAFVDHDGNFLLTLGILPFHQYSVSGGKDGVVTWSYPNLWPGLHASHESSKPEYPGELVGTTRALGGLFTPKGSDVGPLCAFMSAMGALHFMTTDGLYVGTPFQDGRLADTMAMPSAKRGISLDNMSLGGENFWPTLTQTQDGTVYLVNGGDSVLIRMDGFETLRRIPPSPLTITAAQLINAQAYNREVETLRKQEQGSGVMTVPLNTRTPTVDGKLDDWGSNWVEIDKSGTKAWFDSNTKPYNIKGAVAVAGGKLFAAWETADPNLLRNTGDVPIAPFKTGGTLELMIGTDPKADPKRREAVAGDLRLVITRVKDKTVALLYRPVAPGTTTPKVPFTSPLRTIYFDRVDNVSDKVEFAADTTGNYEVSIPLDVIGLKPEPGMRIQGDIGVLRGNGAVTVARTYWSNKATGIVSDVPSEAELMPSFWGRWEF